MTEQQQIWHMLYAVNAFGAAILLILACLMILALRRRSAMRRKLADFDDVDASPAPRRSTGITADPRGGFTLIELMVALALTLLIMVILSQAFILSLETFSRMKGIGDMQTSMRA